MNQSFLPAGEKVHMTLKADFRKYKGSLYLLDQYILFHEPSTGRRNKIPYSTVVDMRFSIKLKPAMIKIVYSANDKNKTVDYKTDEDSRVTEFADTLKRLHREHKLKPKIDKPITPIVTVPTIKKDIPVLNSPKPKENTRVLDLTQTEKVALQSRASLLAEDSELKQTYQDLVAGGVVSDEDFWKHHADALLDSHHVEGQKVSMPPALADMLQATQSKSNIGNVVNVTLDATMIDEIFEQYPRVKHAYQMNVPAKMSEEAFWSKYFREKFFHDKAKKNKAARKRRIGESKTDYSIHNRKKELQSYASSLNPGMDLRRSDSSLLRLDDEARLVIDSQYKKTELVVSQKNSGAAGEYAMHMDRKKRQEKVMKGTNEKSLSFLILQDSDMTQSNTSSSQEVYTQETKDATYLEDLSQHTPTVYNELTISRHLSSFSKQNKKEKAACDDENSAISSLFIPVESNYMTNSKVVEKITHLCTVHAHTSTSNANVQEKEGGDLYVYSSIPDKPHIHIPIEFLAKLNQRHRTCSELLRHFWSCFPVTTVDLKEKLSRIITSLQTQYQHLVGEKNALYQTDKLEQQELAKLLEPMFASLDRVFEYYQFYEAKEKSNNNKRKLMTSSSDITTMKGKQRRKIG